MSGLNASQAAQQLAEMQQQVPPPYLFFGYSPIGKKKRLTSRANASSAPKHMSVLEVYREFRQRVPSGRFTIWTGCKLDAKTSEPRECIALDSQVVEKAYALPLGGLTAPPSKPGNN